MRDVQLIRAARIVFTTMFIFFFEGGHATAMPSCGNFSEQYQDTPAAASACYYYCKRSSSATCLVPRLAGVSTVVEFGLFDRFLQRLMEVMSLPRRPMRNFCFCCVSVVRHPLPLNNNATVPLVRRAFDLSPDK